ncbi:sensor histidine kinase [Mangrovibacillus sp. Mu-81]|jgi:two-component system, OmpR family, bacitracin resistance sensor histidine kinase BceS|uniref:sensor histidine kinase n=1 Tax=Mangrovibacillus sp. Mu-81 TaxID=3121478 RepID=UPI002FE47BC7
MIRKYLWERKSWILLFISLQLLLLFVTYLDSALPFTSIFYVVVLSSLVFTIFLIVRFHRETKFYTDLYEWDSNPNVTGMPAPDSPFERIVYSSLIDHAEQLKGKSEVNRRMLDQEKDELLAWIHEVKTPLTAMSLMIERLADRDLKAPLKYEWLRIHLLLDQQLHQKRMHVIENDLYIEKCELEDILYGEIKILQSWCIQKGIGFDIGLAVTEVLSDSKWLAFMIRQLMTNAVKYSEESDIEVRSYRKEGRTILTILDHGRGIDPKDLPRIFEKGFTSTTDHHNQGSTGMGLYLTKKVAEPLLIDVNVQSTLGEGTLITLTFPKKNEFDHVISK